MTTTTIERPPALLPLDGGQRAFLESGARHPLLSGGIRAGKTWALVAKAWAYIVLHPGCRLVLTEPTWDQQVVDVLLPTWSEVLEPYSHLWHINLSHKRIDIANGSVVLLRAAEDPNVQEHLRGLELAAFGMDEVATGNQEMAFRILQGRLSQVGYPHQGWITTTPKGFNWLWRDWVKETKSGHEVHYVDTAANWHLPADLVGELEQDWGQTPFAAQELQGRFVQYEGIAFPMFNPAIHVRSPDAELSQLVAGLDFGAVSPTALVLVGRGPSGRLWATERLYRRNCSEAELVEEASRCGTYIAADPSGKTVIEAMVRLNLPVTPARSNDFRYRVRLVSNWLSLRGDGKPGLYLWEAPNLVAELQALAYHKPRGLEMLTDRWAPGLDDHAYDALAYALMEFEAQEPEPQLEVVVKGVDGRWR